MQNIRNFVIIAHIDHGKSTLADRMLEATGTVEARRMRPQYLDQLDLERERGITIKMAPVRMTYHSMNGPGTGYVLNLIDTPGHSDFSYEVSRALSCVEGAVLLVDVTKGIQAQTLSNLRQAQKAGLAIIGAVNKIDLQPQSVEKRTDELSKLLGCPREEIFKISGKTGEGVEELLDVIVRRIPPPGGAEKNGGDFQALIFDSLYDDHKGILAYVRCLAGSLTVGEDIRLLAAREKVKVKEVGYFTPSPKTTGKIAEGEIGYIATGLKEPAKVRIGDTAAKSAEISPMQGYREVTPVVFISFYPDGAAKFEDLKKAFERLRLTDPALQFEPDANEALGRGLKAGFLGALHFEIISERLRRDFSLDFITSFPSIAYRVKVKDSEFEVKQSQDWPVSPDKVYQPMIKVEILTPKDYLNQVVNLKNVFDLSVREIHNVGENLLIEARMPLSELIRDFDDQLKSVSAGFASFSYERDGEEEANVSKLEILIAGEVQPALTRIISRRDIEREGRQTVERLKDLLPKQQFAVAIQARVEGRIAARETMAAMRKDVTGYLYGGDRSRKMKLWKKQQRGKERLEQSGRVNVPIEVFRQILKK